MLRVPVEKYKRWAATVIGTLGRTGRERLIDR